jgi:exodeoxyribonuclease VII small subunit
VTDPKQAAPVDGAADDATDAAISALSFEQALDQLTQLVEKLESGQLSLEDSVAAFETGVKLSRRCEALLDSAEQRLQILNDAAAE